MELILNATTDVIIVVDVNLLVLYMNDIAKQILNLDKEASYRNIHLFNDLIVSVLDPVPRNLSEFEAFLKMRVVKKGIITKLKNGTQLSISTIPLVGNMTVKGILITAQDITNFIEMKQELDMAFALTLPNSKIEHKLRSIVEYQDTYDIQSKKITITGVIKNGGYLHVVNCLKLFSVLHGQNITKIIGVDKDKLVQAFIYHDLGKSQPVLSIGDVVDPKEAFEDSRLHAFRSAEIAQNFYNLDDDVVEIIRYHHHSGDSLPDTLPWRLLPMLRVFQLIDGLSAAITRGGVQVEFSVLDCVVQVTEVNHRPKYNGTWQIDLYTGQRKGIN
jgi:hypothetical protein